jgi:hypothetical protein
MANSETFTTGYDQNTSMYIYVGQTFILVDYGLGPIEQRMGKSIHGILSTTAIEILEVLLFFHDELPERLLIFKSTDISKLRSTLLQLIFT